MPKSKKIVGVNDLVSLLQEDPAMYETSARLRRVGNSKGIILSGRLLDRAGFDGSQDLNIQATEGVIFITEQPKKNDSIADLEAWDRIFKTLKPIIKKQSKDLWQGMQNGFDKEEWV